MYTCKGCGKLYLTQIEADLCSPREEWPERYPHRSVEYVSAFGAIQDRQVTDE